MQPMPLCILSNRALEDAHANTPQRSVKQMQPMWLCKPTGTIGNLRAHLKIHRRYIVKQVLLYVALIASCKHLCNRIDCKSEFIPMSAFLYVWHHWTSMNRFELTHLALQFDIFTFGSERCFQTSLGWHCIVTNVALDILSFMYSLHVKQLLKN